MSWMRGIVIAMPKNNDRIVFTTNGAGFASNFNNFLFTYLHAKKNKKPLHVYDRNNPISPNYRMLEESFLRPKDLIYIQDAPKEKNYAAMIRAMAATMSDEILEKEAKALFKLTPQMESQIQTILSNYAFPSFDLGVHIRSGDKIRTGEMPVIPIDLYVKEINATNAKTIFVMTDNSELLDQMKGSLKPSIQVYSLNQTSPCKTGHEQGVFNSYPNDVKLDAYIHFLAELYVMQKIPSIICTFSSNIGRFLYLTRAVNAIFKSLDMKKFIAL